MFTPKRQVFLPNQKIAFLKVPKNEAVIVPYYQISRMEKFEITGY